MRADKNDKNLIDPTAADETPADLSAVSAKDVRAKDKGGKKIAKDKKQSVAAQTGAVGTENAGDNLSSGGRKRSGRIPAVAAVYDGEGRKIGKVRSGVWYDGEGRKIGDFAEREGEICLSEEGKKVAVLDRHDNLVDERGGYIATLRRFPVLLCAVALFGILALTAFFVCLGAYFMKSSDYPDYAPTMFVAGEKNENFNGNQSLSVFYNDLFGGQKIAPGMKGSYAFSVRNDNADTVEFSLVFSCENAYGIDIAYSLSRDGAVISGRDGKVSAEQVSVEKLTIQPLSETVFVLDWEWRDDDETDTEAGENQAEYKLNITFNAQVRQGA